MDLKQLRYFAAVAEEGSITAAARRLYLSQPPLSMQLQALEREVGCSLFERGRRHITLTDAGRVPARWRRTGWRNSAGSGRAYAWKSTKPTPMN